MFYGFKKNIWNKHKYVIRPHLPRPHSKREEPMTREICIILALFLNRLEINTV